MKKSTIMLLASLAALSIQAEPVLFDRLVFSENFDGKTIEQVSGPGGSLDYIKTLSSDRLPVSIEKGRLCFRQNGPSGESGALSGAWGRIRESEDLRLFMLKADITVSNIIAPKVDAGFARLALSNFGRGVWNGSDPYAQRILQNSALVSIKLIPGKWTIRAFPKDGPMLPSGSAATVWLVVNGSGSAISYKAPDGSEQPLDHNRLDVWMDTGNGPSLAIAATECQASEFKTGKVVFNYNPASTATSSADITFDNIEAYTVSTKIVS